VSATQAKLIAAGALALAAYLFRDRVAPDAVGGVELGVPTVDGVYGGYYLTPHVEAGGDGTTRGALATDPTMAALIAQSNAAIAADDAAQGGR
jgi:hypothetical protein